MTDASPTGITERRSARRRLAAVVCIDVVGYTGLMERDEERTHERWMIMRSKIIGPTVEAYGGSIVKSTGDGYLVEFPSALDGTRFALELQRLVGSAGDAESPIRLRVALHIGDVIVEPDDIFGDGVNVAARLQEFADPGGIILSATVHELVRHLLSYTATEIGPLELKNIRRAVLAYKVNSAAADVAAPAAARARERPSIAVLPPRALGDRARDRFLAAGMAHQIATSLASLRELFVVSSDSSIALAEREPDIEAIGARLGVRYLVTGQLSRAAGNVDVLFELRDVRTQSIVWTDQYEAAIPEIFSVHDNVAMRVAYALVPHLRTVELQRALGKRPESMDAYDHVLRALSRMYRFGPGDFSAARASIDKAIEQDPRYATAYALRAKWHVLRVGQGYSTDELDDAEQAAKFAGHALEHDPSDPLGLAIYGHTQAYLLGNLAEAVETFDRAISSCPSSALAWGLSSPTYSYLGDGPSAVDRARYALVLSPLDPYSHFFRTALTLAHYVNGTYEEAVHWGERTYTAAPRFSANLRPLIASLVALNRIDEAAAIARHLVSLEPKFSVNTFCRRYPLQGANGRQMLRDRLLAAGLPE